MSEEEVKKETKKKTKKTTTNTDEDGEKKKKRKRAGTSKKNPTYRDMIIEAIRGNGNKPSSRRLIENHIIDNYEVGGNYIASIKVICKKRKKKISITTSRKKKNFI